MSRKAITWTVIAAVALVAVMAYGSSRQRVDQPDDATIVAESMLTAFNTDDYESFSANFTSGYRKEMDQAAFEEWRTPLLETLGQYQSITKTKVKEGEDSGAVTYVFTVSFEKSSQVQFTVQFKAGSTRVTQVALKPKT